MFGTLKPPTCGSRASHDHRSHLGCGARRQYATFYCGLCKSLGDHFGQVTRGLLNYDAVFLALVADGLVDEGAAPDRCRCPIMPVAFRPTVRPDSPAMRYAAAMQMMLSDQWLADRAMDGRRAARVARPLLASKVEHARAILGELGISLADLEGFEHTQARAEIVGATGPREAAEPTASALERVFDRMALLPGVPDEGRSAASREALASFGRRLGSAIYLIDALDDLEKDHARGAFNPCLTRGSRVSWSRIETAWRLLHDDLVALADLVAILPLRRHREIVRSVVTGELPQLARDAAKRAHAYARADLTRTHADAWPRRVLASAAALFVFLWVWLSSSAALAKAPKRPLPSARDAGAAGRGTPPAGATPPESWDPHLTPPASAAPPPRPPPEGSAAPSASPPAKPSSAAPPPAPPPSASPGGKGGGGCGNPCSGCDSGGAKPCNACSDCCDVCRRGDCGGCCKACDSCGSCGSCCNGCNCGSCGK